PRRSDALAPRPNECRPDDFANIELAREMRAERMPLFLVHAVLEERSEDFRTHVRPIFRSRFAKAICFGALEFNRLNNSEQAAIKILNALVAPARRRFFARHLAK